MALRLLALPLDLARSISDGSACSLDGSDNYHQLSLSYDASTGIFSGSMTTNLCSNDHYGYCALCDPPGYTTHKHSASCTTQSLPAVTGPAQAPLRGRIGLSRAGVNIYGPEEAGFGIGFTPKPCTDGTGTCPGGMDVPTCEDSLEITCGDSSKVEHGLMLDTCGGHAMPYHYHGDNACDYDHTKSGHSPLIGFGLDGIGIYGLYETNPSKPTDLDACNGHVGPVPADSELGVSGGSAYHYHVTSWAPYTLGCYGDPTGEPVTQEQCKTFYPASTATDGSGPSVGGCNDGTVAVTTSDHQSYCYDLDCPCFDGRTSKLGRNTEDTSCLSTQV
jgi:hypothetical protein